MHRYLRYVLITFAWYTALRQLHVHENIRKQRKFIEKGMKLQLAYVPPQTRNWITRLRHETSSTFSTAILGFYENGTNSETTYTRFYASIDSKACNIRRTFAHVDFQFLFASLPVRPVKATFCFSEYMQKCSASSTAVHQVGSTLMAARAMSRSKHNI
jgi:hypothetical protein